MFYPATITPFSDGSGRYGVTFIDLPGCVASGDNLEDALLQARENLIEHVGKLCASGASAPPPTPLEDAKKRDILQMRARNLEPVEGTLYQFIQFEPGGEKSPTQRISISLKAMMIERIDKMAREMGITRSAFIALATREYCRRYGGLEQENQRMGLY